MQSKVNESTRFPPAESPINITFSGLIEKYL